MYDPLRVVTLVAGGAGFLGFHLCKRLLGEGARVLCLDDMSSGQQDHIDELSQNKNFRFIRHDITEQIDPRVTVGWIFNLACPASPVAYQRDPIKTTLVNVVGTRNLLELARMYKARFVQASTSEVYGDPLVHPQSESYCGNVNTTGLRSCYDEGKRCAETLVSDYHRVHGIDVRIARIFNTYGPHMREDDGRVVTNFIVQALQGQDITIYGDGVQTRSMCYVDDLIEGLMRLIAKDADLAHPINLGNPCEITILELARLVVDLTRSASRIVHLPRAADDPRMRRPNIDRAKTELNWEPTIALKDGLQETIAFIERELAKPMAA